MTQSPAVRHVLALAVATETVEGQALQDAIVAQPDETEVVVVAPVLNTRLRHWTSDEDRARTAADTRLGAYIAALDDVGVNARRWLGDADPIQAIADGLVVLPADELLIATRPEQRSNRLAHDLAERAGDRFSLPVTEIVVAR